MTRDTSENKLPVETNIVPIMFSYSGSEDMIIPLGVCLTSLLEHANITTFYDIFILHTNLKEQYKNVINKLKTIYINCNISYLDVNDAFSNLFVRNGLATATYYKLLAPELITKYDKIIVSDIDIIFRSDLSNMYIHGLHDNQLIAAVHNGIFYFDRFDEKKYLDLYIKKLGCDYEYANTGFLIMNLKTMRDENIVNKFKEHQNKKYLYADQDIINPVCKNRIESLPLKYNYHQQLYRLCHDYLPNSDKLKKEEIDEAEKNGVIHYTGNNKPWNSYCLRYDIWIEQYKRSIFYTEQEYYSMMKKSLNRNIDRMRIVDAFFIIAKRTMRRLLGRW